jgi:quinol monooxygenase YgiN
MYISKQNLGGEDELGSELRALVAPTRQEPGCLAYELHRDPKEPQKFMFYEKFKDQDAFTAHLEVRSFPKVSGLPRCAR